MVVVDSFGSLYAEQIDLLFKKYAAALAGTGKEVGIHAHNNQQLAFANTIEAIIHGCNRVDATMAGLGRGAGNCPMELLLGFLRNPKFNIRPIFEVIQDHVAPLRKELEWGPSIPYNITGQLNQHPRTAIEWREGPDRDDYPGLLRQGRLGDLTGRAFALGTSGCRRQLDARHGLPRICAPPHRLDLGVPVMKQIERRVEVLIFGSRWLLAPFYLGLVAALALLLVKFAKEFIHFVPLVFSATRPT